MSLEHFEIVQEDENGVVHPGSEYYIHILQPCVVRINADGFKNYDSSMAVIRDGKIIAIVEEDIEGLKLNLGEEAEIEE